MLYSALLSPHISRREFPAENLTELAKSAVTKSSVVVVVPAAVLADFGIEDRQTDPDGCRVGADGGVL